MQKVDQPKHGMRTHEWRVITCRPVRRPPLEFVSPQFDGLSALPVRIPFVGDLFDSELRMRNSVNFREKKTFKKRIEFNFCWNLSEYSLHALR